MKNTLPSDVAAVFRSYPKPVKEKLLMLRQLIYEVAGYTDGVGQIEETLKWGQPSYLTVSPKSGTPIRIDRVGSDNDTYALYVHCQTTLIDTFKEMYPDEFTYEGNRSILFTVNDDINENALRHCISLALTYHLRKA